MRLHMMPSGKFNKNRFAFELAMLAFNMLQLLGTMLCNTPNVPMRSKADRHLQRTVIMNIIRMPPRKKPR